jgi:hypothetical protein
MSIKNSVFASKSERGNFYKLRRTWGSKYAIYHNLPFLNVFGTEGLLDLSDWRTTHLITLTELEIARLKKTSIDYTLCDEQDCPILCIEFDGLQQGFNVGTTYYPDEIMPPINVWRKEITELKLKVALGSMFPFFVVGSKQFDDIHPDAKLTIVDAVIGDVLAWKATHAKFSTGFDPDEIGYSQEQFDAMPKWEQDEVIQDWVIGVEVETTLEHNPVARKRAELELSLGIQSWEHESLTYPSLDIAKTIKERGNFLNDAILYGSKVTLHTDDCGDVVSIIWLPNFKVIGYSGLTLCEEVAGLLALEKLKRIRASRA